MCDSQTLMIPATNRIRRPRPQNKRSLAGLDPARLLILVSGHHPSGPTGPTRWGKPTLWLDPFSRNGAQPEVVFRPAWRASSGRALIVYLPYSIEGSQIFQYHQLPSFLGVWRIPTNDAPALYQHTTPGPSWNQSLCAIEHTPNLRLE